MRHRALHRPRAAGRLRVDRHKRHVSRRVGAEHLPGSIERLRGHQIDLTRQRQITEERNRRRDARGSLAPQPMVGIEVGPSIGPDGARRRILQNAARQMPQAPCGFTFVFRCRRGNSGRVRHRRVDAKPGELGRRDRRGLWRSGCGYCRRTIRRDACELNFWNGKFFVGELNGAPARLPVAARVHAEHVRSERQLSECESTFAIGRGHGRCPSHDRDHRPGNRRLLVVEHPAFNAAGGKATPRWTGRRLGVRTCNAQQENRDCRRDQSGHEPSVPNYGATVKGTLRVTVELFVLSLILISSL